MSRRSGWADRWCPTSQMTQPSESYSHSPDWDPMWPWGHLAVGYLVFVVVASRSRLDRTPSMLLAVAVGSQFPDLVDKPLAWTFAILPSGRSLAHSLLVVAVLLAVAYRLAPDILSRALVTAFGIGTVSHSLSDLGPTVLGGLLLGDWTQLQWTTYLLWPVLESPPYPSDSSFLAHFLSFRLDWYVLVQFGLFAVALGVWIHNGATGLTTLRGRLLGRELSNR